MPQLVDKVKISSRGRETRSTYKGEKASIRTRLFLKFLETFSVKNEGFEVLKPKRDHLLIFKDFFSEE